LALVAKRLVRHGCAGTIALAIVLLMVLGTGAGGDAAAAAGSVAFAEAGQGTRDFNMASESEAASGRVLRSAAQATRQLRAWGIDAGAAKGIDFSRQSAIVFLAAYQPTGGYRARISKVVALGNHAVLSAQVRYEGGEVAAASITRPWVVVTAKRSALARVRDVRIRLR
jgi:hypothetical protein